MFGRWDATHALHAASLDSSMNEAFLQHQCIITWDKCGGSRFTHYATRVAPNYKTIFFGKRGTHKHRYILEPIPLSVIRTIASMWLSSVHALRVRRGVGAQVIRVVSRLSTVCPKQVWEFECHTLIQCSTLSFITIAHAFDASLTKLNPCINFSHNYNVHTQFRHSLVKVLNIESCFSLSRVLCENFNILVSQVILDFQRR